MGQVPNRFQQAYAWTGWIYEDLEVRGVTISRQEAENTLGAICLYTAKESPDPDHKVGHIAVSLGNGKIIEAHWDADKRKRGVIASRTVAEAKFKHFYRLPYFQY